MYSMFFGPTPAAKLFGSAEAGGYTGTAAAGRVRLTEMIWTPGPFERGTPAKMSRFSGGEPMLQVPGPDCMGIVWPVKPGAGRVTGAVRYSDRADFSRAKEVKMARSGQTLWSGSVLSLLLGGLKPDTTYYYRTETRLGETDVEVGPLHTFRTAGTSASGGGMSFVLVCNLGGAPNLAAKAMQTAAARRPTVTVWNGGMAPLESREGAVRALTAPVAAGEGASLPVLYVPGPADCRGAWSEQLPEVMLGRPEGERPVKYSDLLRNFALRLGDTALIGLDAGDPGTVSPLADYDAYRALQTDWLKEVLAREDIASAKQAVVFCAVPLNGTAPWQQAWSGLLTQAGVGAVIASDPGNWSGEAVPSGSRSWRQLVCAGAAGGQATLIEGRTAGDGRLTLTVTALADGKQLAAYEVSARA